MTPPEDRETVVPTDSAGVEPDGLPPSAGLSRRGIFVDLISGALGVALTIPLVGYLLAPLRRKRESELWVKIGAANQLRGERRAEVDYAFTRQDAWLSSVTKRRVIVATNPADESKFTVYSSTCTHLGCGVRWDEAKKEFLCPCHGGVFNAEGEPVSGPVFKPLDRLQARVAEDGQLEVLEA